MKRENLVAEQMDREIQNTEVVLEQEEENLGISYEIGFSSEKN